MCLNSASFASDQSMDTVLHPRTNKIHHTQNHWFQKTFEPPLIVTITLEAVEERAQNGGPDQIDTSHYLE